VAFTSATRVTKESIIIIGYYLLFIVCHYQRSLKNKYHFETVLVLMLMLMLMLMLVLMLMLDCEERLTPFELIDLSLDLKRPDIDSSSSY
jgi:hypothetical protein